MKSSKFKVQSSKLEELEEKIVDLENKWKRALADYDNLVKRVEKERQEFLQSADSRLLDKLLAVLDEVKLCRKHTQDKGVALVCDRFWEVLKSEGVETIEAEGKEFDAQTMDAAEIVPGEKNKVVEVINDGYTLGGKVLRPAKVKVGSGVKSN